MHDFQNRYDPNAMALRTDDGPGDDRFLVGWCPRYLLDDTFELLRKNPAYAQARVERINRPPAPLQVRLLCSLTARWPDSFRPFSGKAYRPIPEAVAV